MTTPDVAGRVISLVVFDLGDVLCRFDPDARASALAAASGWSVDAVREFVWGSGRDARADRGELTEDEAFALATLDGTLDRETAVACWSLAFVRDPEMLALIDQLMVPAAVFTNNGPVLEHLFDDHLLPIALRCSPMLCSWRVGATKPAADAFARAAARFDVRPEELLFVDDRPANVEGARASGWQGIVFSGVDDLAREFVARRLIALPEDRAPGRATSG